MARVLFYVQHLLGLGHGARSAMIVRELLAAGLDVTYVTGGMPAETLDLGAARMVQLPPLRAADVRYDGLIDAEGHPPDDGYWKVRREKLTAAIDADPPDVVLIETFPFGRWPFRRELLPVLERVHGRARIFCSVRDILEPKRESRRNAGIVDVVGRYFDLVLVHGDPDVIPLDRTFARAGNIAPKIRYTGYIAPSPIDRQPGGTEVVVSAGGGATCGALMAVAREAARRDDRRWRFLIGPNCPPPIREMLSRDRGITVEPIRADFRDLLARAAVSVSQAGYNTAMDVLTTGVPSVMVPFGGAGQTEQCLRARLLAERRRVAMVVEPVLTADTLLAAIRAACEMGGERPPGIDLDGVRRTVRTIGQGASSNDGLWDSPTTADIKARYDGTP